MSVLMLLMQRYISGKTFHSLAFFKTTTGLATLVSMGLIIGMDMAYSQAIDLDPDAAVETRAEEQDIKVDAPSSEAVKAAKLVEEAAKLVEEKAHEVELSRKAKPAPTKRVKSKKRVSRNLNAGSRVSSRQVKRKVIQSFVLRDIQFSPSSYLTPDELALIEGELVGGRYSLATVSQIAERISAEYSSRNIALAQPNIVQIDMARGLVAIDLFEARLGEIRYHSNALSDRYLAYRLGFRPGDLADNRLIDERIKRLIASDGLEITANFSPGSELGTTDLDIQVGDRKRISGGVTIDNYGSESNGEIRTTASAVLSSLTGWNDPLTASFTYREGSQEIVGAYRRVIHPDGASIFASGSYSESESLAVDPVIGNKWQVTAGLDVPLVMETDRQARMTGSISYFDEESQFLGITNLSQEGYLWRLGGNAFMRGEGWTISASADYIGGRYDDLVAKLDGITYSGLAGNAALAVSLNETFFTSLSFSGQHVFEGEAPSTEFFTVTDPAAVRGYPVSLTSGQSGYAIRSQLEQAKPFEFADGQFGLRAFLFADIGEAFDSDDVGLGLASSVGAGLTLTAGDHLSGDIYVAKPLTDDIVGFQSKNMDPIVRGRLTIQF